MSAPAPASGLAAKSRRSCSNTRVLAYVAGHEHRNRIEAHGLTGGGGFWEIVTASHLDWPQQARVIELADKR